MIALFGNSEVAPELAGSIEAVRVVRDQATNIGKGFAFVLFKTKVRVHSAVCPISLSSFFSNPQPFILKDISVPCAGWYPLFALHPSSPILNLSCSFLSLYPTLSVSCLGCGEGSPTAWPLATAKAPIESHQSGTNQGPAKR